MDLPAAETADSSAGNPVLNIAGFGAVLVITMGVVLRAGKSTTHDNVLHNMGLLAKAWDLH